MVFELGLQLGPETRHRRLQVCNLPPGLTLEDRKSFRFFHGGPIVGQIKGFLVLGADLQAQALDRKLSLGVRLVAQVATGSHQVLVPAFGRKVPDAVEFLEELVFAGALALHQELLKARHIERADFNFQAIAPQPRVGA